MKPGELSGRLSDRVDDSDANHLLRSSAGSNSRDDYRRKDSVAGSQAPSSRDDRIERITQTLSDVDLAVLDSLAIVRMASGRQLNVLHWPLTSSGARNARHRLKRLTDLRVLARPHRQVGGVNGGSQGHTYALDVVGQRIVQANHLRTIRRPTPSDYFVDHTLGITEIFVALRTAANVDLVDFQTEPDCWREFTGPAGRTASLRSDAFAVWTCGEWEFSAFFEVDRATEHPGRIDRKAEQYVRYWRTGQEQRTNQVFPTVVWVTPTERRADVLRAVMAEQDEPALFEVITNGDLASFITNTSREEGHT